jgi:hypothetical protein
MCIYNARMPEAFQRPVRGEFVLMPPLVFDKGRGYVAANDML